MGNRDDNPKFQQRTIKSFQTRQKFALHLRQHAEPLNHSIVNSSGFESHWEIAALTSLIVSLSHLST